MKADKSIVQGLTSEMVDKYKSNPDFYTQKTPSTFFLRLNQKRGGQEYRCLKNKDLRLAIAKAYDKKGLTNVILNDGSTPADYSVPKELRRVQMEKTSVKITEIF